MRGSYGGEGVTGAGTVQRVRKDKLRWKRSDRTRQDAKGGHREIKVDRE